MKIWKLLLFLLGIIATFLVAILGAVPTHADPILQTAVGINGVWADDAEYPSDFELGGNASASLSPHISLVGAGYYGFSHSYVRGSAGLRVTASDVNNPDFSIGLGIQYHVSSEEEVRPQEFAADASIGYRPWPAVQPRVVLIVQGQYGFAHNDAHAISGVRYLLGGGK